jgi:hypothetical protein
VFFRGSRYQDVPTLEHQGADGRVIRYKDIRLIPEPPGFAKHVVDEGERLDHVAFHHYRDPERFWRICDANLAVHPDELTAEPGRVLDVPPPEA